jgi:mono/diheme cytochrome c family protein
MRLKFAMRLSRITAARILSVSALCAAAFAVAIGAAATPAAAQQPSAQQSPAQDASVRQPSDQLPRGERPAVPPSGAEVGRGEALLTEKCAGCHAVGRSGVSPHATAPAFRRLSQRYKIEALEEALAEGLSSGHPDMPEFAFETDDVAAIIAYLNAIQEK